MIEVNSSVYTVFYNKLCNAIIEKEYIKKNVPPPRTTNLWDDITEDFFKKVFGGTNAQSKFYFSKKLGQMKPGSTVKGRVNHEALVRALEYIGISTPLSRHRKKTAPISQHLAGNLLDAFIATHQDEIMQVEIEHSLPPGDEDDILDEIGPARKAKVLIASFFESVVDADYDRLTRCVSNTYRIDQYGSRRDFLMTDWKRLKGVTDVKIFNSKFYPPDMFQCDFYVEELIQMKVNPMISDLTKMRIKDIKTFIENLKKITHDLKKLDKGNKLDNVELYKLFDPRLAYHLLIMLAPETQGSKNLMNKLFPKDVVESRERTYRCVLKLEDGCWKISKLVSVKITLDDDFLG
ncbi:hypothetical protein [Dawidia soli]|uniref:Uncharacterized protein n=1 Tax=Dawidia soli TaxID=2782352 RepID=A0AAP2DFK8_9BACT|nr:hypothetical protein [Dawidia soli]MBT1689880.1 hypothetical protein [Dawidia soli]